jgi:L-rhamnose-H+ transport protein
MNLVLGVLLHALGGFAAGSFYIAFKKVRNWSWESYWLVNGLFTWIIMPWAIAAVTVPQLFAILTEASPKSVFWTFFFGICWGIGNLTFGLSLRYLGMSLGMALVLGLTTTFGTLVPPIFNGDFVVMTTSISGQVTLAGIFVCLIGIVFAGWAGVSKEKELSSDVKQKYIKEFNFKKGLLVAIFSGIMSACFAFAVQAGKPIAELAMRHGTSQLWKNSTVLIIIMGGGFITNAGVCVFMNIRNRSIRDYVSCGNASLWVNYLFCAIAGITGFMEFMFYGMGTTKMGRQDFVSFSIHLAFVIVFSTMWGLITHEWKDSSKRTITLIFLGIMILIISTVVMGFGNYLATLN